MPDDIKSDVSSDEQLTPEAEGAMANGVAEPEAENEPAADEGNDSGNASEAADEGNDSGNASEADAEAAMLAMMDEDDKGDNEKPEGDNQKAFPDLSGVRMEEPVASPAEFQQLSPTPTAIDDTGNIDLLLDVKMPVSIELGRTEMAISDLLAMGPGSVVELNKLAGEPVDLLVNHKIIAKGEVVVVDENFGATAPVIRSEKSVVALSPNRGGNRLISAVISQ